ncbi:MAG: hypothetical protein ABR971_09690 [Acidobacteriaceae bacterium]|jgi:hypothetical protein
MQQILGLPVGGTGSAGRVLYGHGNQKDLDCEKAQDPFPIPGKTKRCKKKFGEGVRYFPGGVG